MSCFDDVAKCLQELMEQMENMENKFKLKCEEEAFLVCTLIDGKCRCWLVCRFFDHATGRNPINPSNQPEEEKSKSDDESKEDENTQSIDTIIVHKDGSVTIIFKKNDGSRSSIELKGGIYGYPVDPKTGEISGELQPLPTGTYAGNEIDFPDRGLENGFKPFEPNLR